MRSANDKTNGGRLACIPGRHAGVSGWGGMIGVGPLQGDVVLYSTPGCHLCETAAQVLRSLRVPFLEVDAREDSERFLRVPVIEVGGEVAAEGQIDLFGLRRALHDFRR